MECVHREYDIPTELIMLLH